MSPALVPYSSGDDSCSPDKFPQAGDLWMLKEGFLSDFQLISSDEKAFPVHKFVLSVHSKFFRNVFEYAAIGDSFRMNDLNNGEIDDMLKFIYGGIIPKRNHWIRLVEVGENYCFPGLVTALKKRIIKWGKPDEAVDMLKVAYKSGLEDLKVKAFQMINDNYTNVRQSGSWDLLLPDEKDDFIDWKMSNEQVV